MLNSELKKDMWVVCLPRYALSDNNKYGGAGYEEGKIFQIAYINRPDAAMPSSGNGVKALALRPATEWEIKHKQVQKEMNYEIY